MKKITSFFTLLLLALCSVGAGAETATLTYDNIQIYNKDGNLVTPGANYSFNQQVRSTSSPLITIAIGTNDVVYNTSKFCFGNNNRTYTLAIADGYYITGFSINYTTGSGVKFTSNGVTSDDDGQLSVTGLNTASTTFYATWNSNGSSSSWENYSVSSIEIIYEAEDADLASELASARQMSTDRVYPLQTTYGLVKAYDATAGNIISNYQANKEGTYAGLVDGTYTTYFHSAYSGAYDGSCTANHNLTFTLDESVDEFYFYVKKRSQNNVNRPTAITVDGSNDGTNWTAIGNVTISGVSAAQNDVVKDYFSAKLGTAGTSYSKIRFTITATNNNAVFGNYPFFTASEWYILPSNDVTDQYFSAAKALRDLAPIASNQTAIETNANNQTNASFGTIFTPSTAANPVWQAMSIGGTTSWWKDNGNNTISNANGNSLPEGTADAYAWAFYGDATNGFKIQNKSTGLYLGGRTASGGTLTLVEEANAVLFVPEYNSATNIMWKSKDYGYYVDRSSEQPYAHTSGQAINFAKLYDVNFTCSQNEVTTAQVGGVEVNVGTNVLIASTAVVTLSESNLTLVDYDGYSTLAEALASGAADDGVILIAAEKEWSYSYEQFDATTRTSLGTGNGTQTSTTGYTFSAPSISGYSFLGAADATTHQDLDLSNPITSTNLVLLYAPILQDVSSANSSKAYTISAPRGFYRAASADASEFTTTAASSGPADMSNPLHQWTIVTFDGNNYLYNIGAKKFASFTEIKDHNLVTSAPAVLSAETSTITSGYPLVLKFTKSGTTYTLNMDDSPTPVPMIDDYTTHDVGNVLQIVQIPDVNVTPEAYLITFTCSSGKLSSIFVDGVEVALNTPIVLTSGAMVSSGESVNAIESYNGEASLAAALAELTGNTGTVDVALPAVLSNITINVKRGTTTVKTVTVENVAENTVLNVADLVGTPNYVSDLTPATITATDVDQTVEVTYTSSLPFTISEDPTSASATEYLLTLNQKYGHGNVLSSSYDLSDDTYFWTFGGDEYNGITVYNKTNGYMSVADADNNAATFIAAPVAFAISSNSNQTDGFNLYLPATISYINDYANNGTISTWQNSSASSGPGSCLKIVSVSDKVAADLPVNILPYFSGCVGGIILNNDYETIKGHYDDLVANPTRQGYLNLVDEINDAEKVAFVDGGYYSIQNYATAYKGTSRGGAADPTGHYMTVNSGKTAPSCTKVSTAMDINYGLWKISAGSTSGKYIIRNARTGKYLATQNTLSDESRELYLEGLNDYQFRIANGAANENANICDGHNTDLVYWTASENGDGAWLLIPETRVTEIQLINANGVDNGDDVYQSFAYTGNVQLPDYMGTYYISSETGGYAHIDTVSTNEIIRRTGYIISGPNGGYVPLLPLTADPSELEKTNLLTGVTTPTTVYSGYILAYKGDDAEPKFYKISSSGLTIPANRSYLVLPEGSNVRGLELLFGGLGDDDVTGIDGISTDGSQGAIFDLQGRRVTKPEKGGIYIVNGKKVMK